MTIKEDLFFVGEALAIYGLVFEVGNNNTSYINCLHDDWRDQWELPSDLLQSSLEGLAGVSPRLHFAEYDPTADISQYGHLNTTATDNAEIKLDSPSKTIPSDSMNENISSSWPETISNMVANGVSLGVFALYLYANPQATLGQFLGMFAFGALGDLIKTNQETLSHYSGFEQKSLDQLGDYLTDSRWQIFGISLALSARSSIIDPLLPKSLHYLSHPIGSVFAPPAIYAYKSIVTAIEDLLQLKHSAPIDSSLSNNVAYFLSKSSIEEVCKNSLDKNAIKEAFTALAARAVPLPVVLLGQPTIDAGAGVVHKAVCRFAAAYSASEWTNSGADKAWLHLQCPAGGVVREMFKSYKDEHPLALGIVTAIIESATHTYYAPIKAQKEGQYMKGSAGVIKIMKNNDL